MTGVLVWAFIPSVPNPQNIPTIKAEGPYKEKPAHPGGLDIPNQDVQIYSELEGKTTPQAEVEHMLPPPEEPHAPPPAAPPVSAPAAVSPPPPQPKQAEPLAAPAASLPNPTPATLPVKPVPAPPPVKASAAPPKPPQPVFSVPPSKGMVSLQLASVPDPEKASTLMKSLQRKQASTLGGVALRLVRADLGARGTFYRIQTVPLPEDTANHICSGLKTANVGCILVRP